MSPSPNIILSCVWLKEWGGTEWDNPTLSGVWSRDMGTRDISKGEYFPRFKDTPIPQNQGMRSSLRGTILLHLFSYARPRVKRRATMASRVEGERRNRQQGAPGSGHLLLTGRSGWGGRHHPGRAPAEERPSRMAGSGGRHHQGGLLIDEGSLGTSWFGRDAPSGRGHRATRRSCHRSSRTL